MKKLMLVAVVALFSYSATAQGVNFGVKAGLNLASITGDDTENLSSLTSFHVGVVADIGVSDNFSVQPELVYSAQGAKYGMSEGYDGKFKLDYFNVPVMAKFGVADGLTLEAGPQVGILLSAKDEYESPGDSGEDDIKEFIKSTDFAVNLGVGYAMASGLNFNARYSLGVGNIWDGDGDGSNQNGVFSFSVGYLFGNGGGGE